MLNRLPRFTMPAAGGVASMAAVPANIGQAQAPSAFQQTPAIGAPVVSGASGMAQIYALAQQAAAATVQNERWNRLLRQLLETDE